MNPRHGAAILDLSEHRTRRRAEARAAASDRAVAGRVRALPGAVWRIGVFHAGAIAMTYGAPLTWGLHGDWRIHIAGWAIYLFVAALEMRALTALRPFSLWAPLLIFAAVDSLTAQLSSELWLTYSLAFLTSCGVNLLLDNVR